MTFEIAAFLALLAVGLVLFAVEWFSADIIALGLMLALILLGLLEPSAAFAGFGSETVLMILGLLVLTETLIHTGLVNMTGQWLVQFTGGHRGRLWGLLLVVPAAMSAFISNTASAAFFLPITLGLANRSRISASKLLMPMAFATILAGSVTLIGTSTNLVVSGLMQQHGLAPLSMFELTPVGLPILIAGLVYMATIGRRLIPDRMEQADDGHGMHQHLYFTEIRVPPQSPLVGQTIESSGLIHTLQLGMLTLQRSEESLKPLAGVTLAANDILLVEGSRENMLRLTTANGIEVSGKIQELEDYLKDGTARIAEVVILPGSPLIGRTIKGLGLRDRYKMQILAINQGGEIRHSKIGRVTLHIGDVLLVKMPRENLAMLESERMFRVLDIINTRITHPLRAILSSVIFGGALLLAVLGLLPIAVAVLLGALVSFLTRCITPEEAYRNIEWKTLVLIGSMLAFGQAMQATGAADYLAQLIVQLPGTENPVWMLTLFFFLALLFTQPMSNQAAAAVLIPIAIQTALLLGFNPRPFAVMIALAASASFITPLEPACLIVYSAGRYRFMDFIRVGGLLTLVVYALAIILVPLIWPVG